MYLRIDGYGECRKCDQFNASYMSCAMCEDADDWYAGGSEHVVYIALGDCNSLTLDVVMTKLVYTHGIEELSRIMGVSFKKADGCEEYLIKVHPAECPWCFVQMVKQNFRQFIVE